MWSLLDMHWHIPVCVCLGETLGEMENVVHFGVTSWTSGKGWGGGPLTGASPLGFDLEKLLRCPGASHVWERGYWVGRVTSSLSFSPGRNLYWSAKKTPGFPLLCERWWLTSPAPSVPPPSLVAIIYLFPRKCQRSAKSGQGSDRKYSLPPLLIYVSLLNLKPTEVIDKFIFSSVRISATLKLDWT